MPKPKLALETVRLHLTPVYHNDVLTGFAPTNPPEARGTLYLPAGGTMKLWQPLNDEEWRELDALLERVSARILASMTAALGPEELDNPHLPDA